MTFAITLIVIGFIVGFIYVVLQEHWAKPQRVEHDYFSRLWLWPEGQETRWEAEIEIASPYASETIGVVAEDNYSVAHAPEPTAAEVSFCRALLADIEGILIKSKDALGQGWTAWFHEELPTQWQNEFKLDGFSVPVDGDSNNDWGITFFCVTAGHYFHIGIQNDQARLEQIDG